jgi:putative transposase
MLVGLERRQQTGQFHFITFSCYDRCPYLEDSSSKDIRHPLDGQRITGVAA